MKKLLNWWYSISLPRRTAKTPIERERERYAHLTSGFLLLMLCLFIPVSPIMLFFSPASPSSPFIAVAMFFIFAFSWICGRAGWQALSAISVIATVFLSVTGPLLTNPLDSSLVPLFGVLTIAVILAGALLPPVAALITGALCCVDTIAVVAISLNVTTYNKGGQLHLNTVNVLTITVLEPITTQIVVAILIYVIMHNLVNAIRRADRAEEVIALQEEIAAHERERLHEKEQLEIGFRRIAETHARIANGDYQARVSLGEGDVLWSVAVPLNNLLNRLQYWKNDADTLAATTRAATGIAEQMDTFLQTGQLRALKLTGTALDPVVIEINQILALMHTTIAHRRT